MNDTGSHRIPAMPPFEMHTTVRFIGGGSAEPYVADVPPGTVGTIVAVDYGRQGTGQIILRDKHGDVLDVSVDGYSLAELPDGRRIHITADTARYFEVIAAPGVELSAR